MMRLYQCPLGSLSLEVDHGNVVKCRWVAEENPCKKEPQPDGCNVIDGAMGNEFPAQECQDVDAAVIPVKDCQDVDAAVMVSLLGRLDDYFAGRLREFSLPVELRGTPFQKRVWEEMRKVGYGETITYGELADRIGNRKALRAVAQACGANPVAVIVPCHRIVGRSGSGGYAGGVAVKESLLALETSHLWP